MNGNVVPEKARLGVDNDRPKRANPRHLIMVSLRKRVWKKVGWADDGKGRDPWGGRRLEGVSEGGALSGEEAKGRMPPSTDEMMPDSEQLRTQGGSDTSGEMIDTGVEELDSLLTGDLLNMFQWDEWESLTSDFFAS